MVNRRRFFKIYSLKFFDIWQNSHFNRIFNNENFKMEAERTIFVTQLMIKNNTYNYIIDYPKTRLLKFGQISFKW